MNIQITTTTTHIEFYFNDVSAYAGVKEDLWPKSGINRVALTLEDTILVQGKGGITYNFTYGGVDGELNVASVNNVSVTSKSQLFSLIEAALVG